MACTTGARDLERAPSHPVASGRPKRRLSDRSGEQVCALRHVADPAPQQFRRQPADVDSVHEHRALGGVDQARDEVDDRRLAGAGAADDRRRLAGFDSERDVVEYWMAGARVRDRDVTELQAVDVAVTGDPVHIGREHIEDQIPDLDGTPAAADRGIIDNMNDHHLRHQDLRRYDK